VEGCSLGGGRVVARLVGPRQGVWGSTDIGSAA
jgi:hypothetical protein